MLVVCTLSLATACGQNGQALSVQQSNQLTTDLNRVLAETDALNCTSAERVTLPGLSQRVATLPATVDPSVRLTLESGVDHLAGLVRDRCDLVSVPNVVGGPLDVAEAELSASGLRPKETGGGLFGIVLRHAWRACAAIPAPGTRVAKASTVTLVASRSC